jgi:hypothetical protein
MVTSCRAERREKERERKWLCPFPSPDATAFPIAIEDSEDNTRTETVFFQLGCN